MFKSHSDQMAVTFKDVAIYFSEEAWHLLEEWQKELYKIVMKEIHGALLSLGYTIANPDILFRIKKEDEPCGQDDDDDDDDDEYQTRQEHSSDLNTSPPVLHPDIFLRIEQDEHRYVGGHPDLVKGLSSNNPSSGLPVAKRDFSRKVTEKKQHSFDLKNAQEREHNAESPNHNPDFVMVVKEEEEEEDFYFIDNHDLERKQMNTNMNINARTNVKKKEMFKEEYNGNRMVHAMSSSKNKASGFWVSEKQTGSRQMDYKVNQSNLSVHKQHKSTVIAQRLSEAINPIFQKRSHMSRGQFSSHELDGLIDKSNGALRQRIRIGPKPFHCDACGKNFTKSSQLFRHRRIHTGDRPLKCAQCEKNFSTACNLIRHQWTHAGEIRYKCTDCDKSFGFLRQLQLHFHQTHVKQQTNPCSEYDKNVGSVESLKLNSKAQTGESPYMHTDGKKSFRGGLGVIQHQVTHTRALQHKCTYCGKGFQQRSNLTRHMRIHTGEKPYTCTECEKSFNQSSTLRSHQRCHTGEKPYSCPVCGKCYSRLSYLSQHKKTHK